MMGTESGKTLYYRYDETITQEQRRIPIVWNCKTKVEFYERNDHLGDKIIEALRIKFGTDEDNNNNNNNNDLDTLKTINRLRAENEVLKKDLEKEQAETTSAFMDFMNLREKLDKKEERIKELERKLKNINVGDLEVINKLTEEKKELNEKKDELLYVIKILQKRLQEKESFDPEDTSVVECNINTSLIGYPINLFSDKQKTIFNKIFNDKNPLALAQQVELSEWLWYMIDMPAIQFVLSTMVYGALELSADELGYPLKDLLYSKEIRPIFCQFVARKFISPKTNAQPSGMSGAYMQYRVSGGFYTNQQDTKWLAGAKFMFANRVYYADNDQNNELNPIKEEIESSQQESIQLIAKYKLEDEPAVADINYFKDFLRDNKSTNEQVKLDFQKIINNYDTYVKLVAKIQSYPKQILKKKPIQNVKQRTPLQMNVMAQALLSQSLY